MEEHVMMKKRIALLGLLGCMALCSERVQAVSVFFDGQIYELSDADYKRYETISRIRKTGGDTQEKADARVRELLAKFSDQIVKPVSAVEETSASLEPASQKRVGPPVAKKPTQAQLDAAVVRRAAATSAPVAQAVATAASASAAQSSEMCCSGQHRNPTACSCAAVTPRRGTTAQDVLSAKRMAFSRMDPSDHRYAVLKAELDLASELYAAQLAQELGNLAVDCDDEEFARQVQEEEYAKSARKIESTSPELSTGSVTPPVAVSGTTERPHDVKFTEVMVVKPLGMSDDVWAMVQAGQMTIEEATEYLVLMAQAEAEEAANVAAMRAAQVDLEAQAVADLIKAERIDLLIQKYQAYAATRLDLGLSINQVVDMIAAEVVLEAAERAALEAAFIEVTEAAGLRVLQARLTQ
jgi:hypothetical protein